MQLSLVSLLFALAVSADPSATAQPSSAATTRARAPDLAIAWLPARVRRHAPQIIAAARRHSVDPRLVAIVVLAESGGDPRAESPTGALGLMQIMPATAARLAADRGAPPPSRAALLHVPTNLDYGARLLAQLVRDLTELPLDADGVHLVAAAYNGGIEQALAHVAGAPLSAETEIYAARVRALWIARDAAERP